MVDLQLMFLTVLHCCSIAQLHLVEHTHRPIKGRRQKQLGTKDTCFKQDVVAPMLNRVPRPSQKRLRDWEIGGVDYPYSDRHTDRS